MPLRFILAIATAVASMLAFAFATPAEAGAAPSETTLSETSASSQAPAGETTSSVRTTTQAAPARPSVRTVRVTRVVDGDTVKLANGKTVRLLQIDTPETSGECYGDRAERALMRILPVGARVRLERDPALDAVDRYGRILRYIHKGRTNVNLALVRAGAASVYFYQGERGHYAQRLLAAAGSARAHKRGAWGACRAIWSPTKGFDTFPKGSAPPGAGTGCKPGYRPCLPIRDDLDCDDVRRMGKAPVQVTGSDPYKLDGNGDGIAC